MTDSASGFRREDYGASRALDEGSGFEPSTSPGSGRQVPLSYDLTGPFDGRSRLDHRRRLRRCSRCGDRRRDLDEGLEVWPALSDPDAIDSRLGRSTFPGLRAESVDRRNEVGGEDPRLGHRETDSHSGRYGRLRNGSGLHLRNRRREWCRAYVRGLGSRTDSSSSRGDGDLPPRELVRR